MTLTNFPNGLTSFGVPILGSVANIPFTGNYYFVDYVGGLDGNSGLSPSKAIKTLDRAQDLMTAGQNDIAFIIGDGATTGSARLTETLVWAKDACHIVGITAPVNIASRARIAALSGSNFTPLVKVTGDGCMFANFSTFHGYAVAEAQICWEDQGQRNYYGNIQFGGMGAAEAGDQAGSASLYLNGADECVFDGCVIGLDTIPRSTTNGEILVANAATRNQFRNCLIPTFADNSGHVFVSANTAAAIDRFLIFWNCLFMNAVNSTATAMTEALSVHASVGGSLMLKNCTLLGATDWEASGESANTWIDGAAPTNNTSGLAVLVEAT